MAFFVEFTNKFGTVHIDGDSVIRVSEIEGLAPVGTQQQTVRLIGVAGERTLHRHQEPRYISMTGRIKGQQNHVRNASATMARIFDNLTEGELTLNMYGKIRKIKCVSESLDLIPKKNDYIDFVLTLKADDPYFYEWQGRKTHLFFIVNNLFDGMTFPRAFSYLNTSGTVTNETNKEVEPTITIYTGDRGAQLLTGLQIKNLSNGAVIDLKYSPEDGEIITIDIADRRITSTINGDITRYIDPYTTFLSEFVLLPGNNEIEFENLNVAQPTTADITYRILHGEAVY